MGELVGLEKAGIAGICIAVLIVGYKVFQLFIGQWKNSTDAQNISTEALNRNTQSFEQLSAVFERQHEREIQFQQEVRTTMHDTHRKVSELHGTLVVRRRAGDQTSEGGS